MFGWYKRCQTSLLCSVGKGRSGSLHSLQSRAQEPVDGRLGVTGYLHLHPAQHKTKSWSLRQRLVLCQQDLCRDRKQSQVTCPSTGDSHEASKRRRTVVRGERGWKFCHVTTMLETEADLNKEGMETGVGETQEQGGVWSMGSTLPAQAG